MDSSSAQEEMMMEWCLCELREAGVEGIPIFVLFNKLDLQYSNPGVANKASLWNRLATREEVCVVEANGNGSGFTKLRDSSVGAMELQKVLTSSFGGRMVRFVSDEPNAAMENGSSLKATKGQATTKQPSITPTPEVPIMESAAMDRVTPQIQTLATPSNAIVQDTTKTSGSRLVPSSQVITSNQAPVRPTLQTETANPLDIVGSKREEPTKKQRILVESASVATPKNNIDQGRKPRREISPERPMAVYTSQADLDLQDGLPGVYVKPAGYKAHRPPGKGRPARSCLVVFKFDKLKDPEWLEKRRGTWIEVSAERLASRLIENEDQAKKPHVPRKRKRVEEDESATPKKIKRVKSDEVVLVDDKMVVEASSSLLPNEESRPIEVVTEASVEIAGVQATSVPSSNGIVAKGQESEVSTKAAETEYVSQFRQMEPTNAQRIGELNAQAQKDNHQSASLAPNPTTPSSSSSAPPIPRQQEALSSSLTENSSTQLNGVDKTMGQTSQPSTAPTSNPGSDRLKPVIRRIAHPFDPSQDIFVEEPVDSAPITEDANVAFAPLPQKQKSPPITPSKSYHSPYHVADYTSQFSAPKPINSQFGSHFRSPGGSYHPQSQWPGSQSETPSNSLPNQSTQSRRMSELLAMGTLLPSQFQDQPQRSSNTLDFHNKYSALYTPQHPAQDQSYIQQFQRPSSTLPSPAIVNKTPDIYKRRPSSLTAARKPKGKAAAGASKRTNVIQERSVALQPSTDHIMNGIASLQQDVDHVQMDTAMSEKRVELIQDHTARMAQPVDAVKDDTTTLLDPELFNMTQPEISISIDFTPSQPLPQNLTVDEPSFQRLQVQEDSSLIDHNVGGMEETEASLYPLVPEIIPPPAVVSQTLIDIAEAVAPENVEVVTESSVPQLKRKWSKKPVSKPAVDDIAQRLAPAEAISIPDGIIRLACIFKEEAGNLILRPGKDSLEFYATTIDLSEEPTLTLHVGKISQHPITSAPGSKRMELHVKSSNDEGQTINHCFIFAKTPAGGEAASQMRAKIVAAMITLQFRSVGNENVSEKKSEPKRKKQFVCEKCETVFKGINGLQYHQTKSASPCNPDHIPKPPKASSSKYVKKRNASNIPNDTLAPRTLTPRKARPRRQAISEGDEDSDEGEFSETSRAPKSRADLRRGTRLESKPVQVDNPGEGDTVMVEAPLEDSNAVNLPIPGDNFEPETSASHSQATPKEQSPGGDSDASHTSQDSFEAWAEKHTTTGVERVPKTNDPLKPRPKNPLRLYKALNRETEVLAKILSDVKILVANEPTKSVETLPMADVAEPNHAGAIADMLLPDHPADTMTDDLCEAIMLSVITAHGGIFPGDRSLWFAIMAVWLKMHPDPEYLPRSTVALKAFDVLYSANKIERITFTFHNRRHKEVPRSIVCLMGMNHETPEIENLKTLIKNSNPDFYVPLGFTPPPTVFDTLQILAGRAVVKKNLLGTEGPVVIEDVQPSTEEPESPVTPTPEDAPFDDFDDDDEFVDTQDPAVESESDGEAEMDDAESESDPQVQETRAKGGPHKRKRSSKHNAAIAESLRRKWDSIRAGGDNPFQKARPLTDQPRRTRGASKRLTQEERDRRAEVAALKQQSWGQAAPAFLPNPETGAWSQKPVVVKKERPYSHRRLPEPVTYLQDTNTGAWSTRPFGHGVYPIHARPARRADGNPLAESYMKKVEKSFRPIVYPQKNVRYGPAPPSKALMQSIIRGAASSDGEAPKRRAKSRAVRNWIEPDNDEGVTRKISLVTGRPMRNYRKKKSVSPEDETSGDGEMEDAMDLVNLFGNGNKRSRAQKARFVSEVELLNFFEPKKLAPGVKLNPGLETLPPSFGLDPSYYRGSIEDLAENKALRLQFRTPRDASKMLSDPNYASWTVDSMVMAKDASYNVRWDEQTAFTLENLPYSQLIVDDISLPDEPQEAPRPKRQKVDQEGRWKYSRILTTHVIDFDGIFNDPYDALNEFNIQIGQPLKNGRKRRHGKIPLNMPPDIERVFLLACVMTRTLTGGLDALVDWVIINPLFPQFSPDYMKRQFGALTKTKEALIERLVIDFQDAYLRAYENGEVDPIDYDDLPSYDWQKLLDWCIENIDTEMTSKTITLPDSREVFDAQHNAVILDRDEYGWRDNYFGTKAPVYRRVETSAAEPHCVALPTSRDLSQEEISQLEVAKSWVRAIALTPDKDYIPSVAKARLDSIGLKLANSAFDALVASKTIMHRNRTKATVGRGYEAAETFFRPLNKYLKNTHFYEAIRYKTWLDEQFLNGAPYVRADYLADNGAIMVMTSLQAHGRVKLIAIDVPMDRFGLTTGGYETRSIPREKLRFEMDIYPTESYVYDFDNPVLAKAMETLPPGGSEKGELPVWYGVTERLITDIWGRILTSVGCILAFRAGTNMALLKSVFRSVMEEWEFWLLMAWGEKVGVFERIGGAGVDGKGKGKGKGVDGELTGKEAWVVGEWWWLVAGMSLPESGRLGRLQVEAEGRIGDGNENEDEEVEMGGM